MIMKYWFTFCKVKLWLNNTTQRYLLISGACYTIFRKWVFPNAIKGLKIWRLFWIIWWTQNATMCPYRREPKGTLTHTGESDVKSRERLEDAGLED
jgi:hypothetical protein